MTVAGNINWLPWLPYGDLYNISNNYYLKSYKLIITFILFIID